MVFVCFSLSNRVSRTSAGRGGLLYILLLLDPGVPHAAAILFSTVCIQSARMWLRPDIKYIRTTESSTVRANFYPVPENKKTAASTAVPVAHFYAQAVLLHYCYCSFYNALFILPWPLALNAVNVIGLLFSTDLPFMSTDKFAPTKSGYQTTKGSLWRRSFIELQNAPGSMHY